MKKIDFVIAFAAIAVLFSFISCSGCSGNGTTSTGVSSVAEKDTPSDAVMTVDKLLDNAEGLVGKEVEFEGICTHTCSHGARKMFLMGSDDTKVIRVESGDLGSFDTECAKNLVKVKGIVNEQRIDEAYLLRWEDLASNVSEEDAAGCDSEKAARGEQGETVEERISDFRRKLENRRISEGKDYLSFYYVVASSYSIEDAE